MTKKKIPGQQLVGTADFQRVVAAIGDDPATLRAVIALADRLIARRRSRRGKKKSSTTY